MLLFPYYKLQKNEGLDFTQVAGDWGSLLCGW